VWKDELKDGQKDGQTDRHYEANGRCSQFRERTYKMKFSYRSPANLHLATNVSSQSQTLSCQFLQKQSCFKISVKCKRQSMFLFNRIQRKTLLASQCIYI